MKACVAIGGRPLVHPAGHPLMGQVVEFDLSVPGQYDLEFRLRTYYMKFAVEINEDCQYRVVLVDKHLPDQSDLGALLSPSEREMLDGLAHIIVRDLLRKQGWSVGGQAC